MPRCLRFGPRTVGVGGTFRALFFFTLSLHFRPQAQGLSPPTTSDTIARSREACSPTLRTKNGRAEVRLVRQPTGATTPGRDLILHPPSSHHGERGAPTPQPTGGANAHPHIACDEPGPPSHLAFPAMPSAFFSCSHDSHSACDCFTRHCSMPGRSGPLPRRQPGPFSRMLLTSSTRTAMSKQLDARQSRLVARRATSGSQPHPTRASYVWDAASVAHAGTSNACERDTGRARRLPSEVGISACDAQRGPSSVGKASGSSSKSLGEATTADKLAAAAAAAMDCSRAARHCGAIARTWRCQRRSSWPKWMRARATSFFARHRRPSC